MLIIVHQLILLIAKKIFLVLGKGDTFGINGSVMHHEKGLVLTSVNQRPNSPWVFIVMVIIVIVL